MIRTKFSLDGVPTTWIFEKYLRLSERLQGQDVKITSVFKPDERTPSMYIYMENGVYKFKDFSSGKQGNEVDLIMAMYNLTWLQSKVKILDDYAKTDFDNYEEIIYTQKTKYKVTGHTKRRWNELDAKYWTQFGIGSRLLGLYNVIPLAGYQMTKDDDMFTVNGQYIYGYFKSNGELYKIYQPKKKDYKFLTIDQHIQGSDQLSYTKPILLICSSLKDIMSLVSLDLELEAEAPSSENSMLPREILSARALKYRGIFTLFDNDEAGHKAMEKYRSRYGIRGVYLNLSKDLSDSVRDHGPKRVRQQLKLLLPKI